MQKPTTPPTDDEALPLEGWAEALSELPGHGRERRRQATPSDLTHLADALDLIAVTHLSATFKLQPQSRGRVLVEGRVKADVTQTCVVSLEPVPGSVDETFACEYWPSDAMPEAHRGEVDVTQVLDIEPFEHGIIPVGRLIYETVAAGLDPNPRKADAAFDWTDPKTTAADMAKPNPFAALKNLKLGPEKA